MSPHYFFLALSLMDRQHGNEQEKVCSSMDQVSPPDVIHFQHHITARQTKREGVYQEDRYYYGWEVSNREKVQQGKPKGGQDQRTGESDEWL